MTISSFCFARRAEAAGGIPAHRENDERRMRKSTVPMRKNRFHKAGKQKGRSTLSGSALILSDSGPFDDVDTVRIHFSGRAGICTFGFTVSRAILHHGHLLREESWPLIWFPR
jgi:hypothetical protein